MGYKQRKGRDISGIILLDKPQYLSSNQALQRVKKLFKAQKAGHTGSLDPLATGMLPLCLGEATKFAQFLLDADKSYEVTVKLGIKTITGDAEGEIIAHNEVPVLTQERLDAVLSQLRGSIVQRPPLYSALKYRGQPLYKWARQGVDISPRLRVVTIYQLELLTQQPDLLTLFVVCSKGTYIRALVETLGEMLGCGAHVAALHRTAISTYHGYNMVSLPDLEAKANIQGMEALDTHLLPVSSMLSAMPKITLSASAVQDLQHGLVVDAPKDQKLGLVRLFTPAECFIGLGEVEINDRIVPRRLMRVDLNDPVKVCTKEWAERRG